MDHPEIPKGAWAGIRRFPHTAAFKIYAEPSLDLPTDALSSEYPIVPVRHKSDAHVSLHSTLSGPSRTFTLEIPDLSLVWQASSIVQFQLSVTDRSLTSILAKIAHFHFHLHRQKSVKGLVVESEAVSLRLYRLKEGTQGVLRTAWPKKNLFKKNVAHIDMADAATFYGIEILNRTAWDLYVHLFVFNPFDYSVNALQMPQVGSSSAPLKAHQSITVGYGSGDRPLSFAPEGTVDNTAFFKCIVCTENIDLYHMLQSSPFKMPASPASDSGPTTQHDRPRMGINQQAAKPDKVFWDTASAAVIMSSSYYTGIKRMMRMEF
ncbi:hypothetical protein DFH07DRAFT_966928 [Mycena maculata]|uniref:Uncharacterized protein n=1 Tax=Mycena maculata TaxID=230809 RepID=A0AAD7I6J5_9AGAR|nr:hypothetical protein DFH07DRAFT_966928 [Mycena maculata]